jgi:HAMP domain-containing protein
MIINGTLVISKTPPLIAKEGVVWIDTSTDIPKIKHISRNGWVNLNDIPIGTTADTVAAGNHNHAITAHATSGLSAAANIQDLAQALSTRIKALENAVFTPQ